MADIAHQQELQSRIVWTLIDSARPATWTRMTMFWSALGGSSHAWLEVTDSAGVISSPPFPREVAGALSDLKAAMADPAKGTWVSALVLVLPDGRFRFDFDRDRRVSWRVRGRELDGPGEDEEPYPDDALWMTEFARFPRQAAYLPPWAPREWAGLGAVGAARARAAEVDVIPPVGLAAVAGQEGWSTVLTAVPASVKACIERLDPADLLDLGGGRRREEILARLRQAAVADGAHRIVDASPDAQVLTLWRGLAALRPTPPGIDTAWTSPVDRAGPRWARVREDIVEVIDRMVRHELAARFPPAGLVLTVDRDSVAAGDDLTSHRQAWTFTPEATVDGVLLAVVRGYHRANVHGGASWLVELRCAGRTTPMAVVIDHDRSGGRTTEVLSLLPRAAGRALAEVSAVRPGEQVEIYLRYLVNSRLLTPDELATLRTVSGADPQRVVKDDQSDRA